MRYGGMDIRAFAKAIEEDAPAGIRDHSIDIAYHLAMALIYLQKLRESGVQTTYRRKKLIEPELEDAFRKLVFIRQRYIDTAVLNDIFRQVTLSSTGKVMLNDSPDTDKTGQRKDNVGTSHTSRQRVYRRTNSPRYRRRVTRKRTGD